MTNARCFARGLALAVVLTVGQGFQTVGSARPGARALALRSRRSQRVRMSSDYLSNIGGQSSFGENNPVYAPPVVAAVAASHGDHGDHGHGEADWLDKLNDKVDGGIGSGMLLAATVVSICLANSGMAVAWLDFWNTPSGVTIGQHVLSKRLLVNEGFMSLFFFMVGLEIKNELVDGSLADIRQAVLPCIAACGGMIVPMAIYALVNTAAGPAGSMAGVTVPMATDIAFAMGVFGAFAGKFPAAVSAFLLTLATVDDLGAIAVIATCFATHVQTAYLAAAAGVQGLLLFMNNKRVVSGKSYFAVGFAMWWLLVQGGINADIAGFCAGLCVWGGKGDTHNIHRLVKYWKPICGLAIMPLFALANCAVPIVGPAAAASAGAAKMPVALGIGAGLIIGKPLGIMGFTALAVKLGIATYPEGMVKAHLPIVGLLGGIGFTMCIFLIEQAIPPGLTSTMSKVAVMVASATCAVLGAGLMSNWKDGDENTTPPAPA